jgi:alpha-beta hydrolase superfamily lysophospholipase
MTTNTPPAPPLPTTATTRDGLALALTHWPLATGVTPRGVVCLVHGLGEHAGRYAHVASFLNEAGWAVVAYDHRGHGRSPGPRGGLAHDDDLLHDLAAVIDTLRRTYPSQRLLVLGHSMGGLTVARFVASWAQPVEDAPWRRPVDLCVLSSPALDIGLNALQKGMLGSLGRLTPDLAVGNGLKPEWVCSDPAVVQRYVDDPLVHDRITARLTRFMLEGGETVHARAASWAVPTLLIYAGSDRCVRPAGSERFNAAAPRSVVTTKAYPHMAHEILNEPDQTTVLKDLGDWLAAH